MVYRPLQKAPNKEKYQSPVEVRCTGLEVRGEATNKEKYQSLKRVRGKYEVPDFVLL